MILVDVCRKHKQHARFEDVERCMQATGVDAVLPPSEYICAVFNTLLMVNWI